MDMSKSSHTIHPDEEKSLGSHDSQNGEMIVHEQPMSFGRYAATRFTSLKPPMTKLANPITLLRMLNKRQWAFFAVAFWAWSWDSFDFFTVSLTVSDLAATFNKSTTDITWGITLVLMLRSVGSVVFGIAADRYGRKWPFITNLVLLIVLELGTGFTQTYKQFLACRALLGIAMGGLYGNAAVTALEDCPMEAQGLISGLMQQGYAFGYLLATAFSRGLVDTTSHGWRPLFWFGAAPPVLIIAGRLYLGETKAFQDRQEMRKEQGDVAKMFIAEGKVAIKRHWLLLVYLILLTSGFNFMAHGTQDLYPTMLKSDNKFDTNMVTVTQVVANLGAICGGTIMGYCSQFFGRRLSMMFVCVVGGALLYPYTYVRSTSVMAVAFFVQFCIQGAWSIVPIYIMELSPGSFRTFMLGSAYQIGNLASSASSTIESRLGEHYPLPSVIIDGKVVKRYDYSKVVCILMGAIYAYSIIMILIGPEKRGRDLDVANDQELAEVIRNREARD